MSIHILDKAYTVNQPGGVSAHRVVVQGASAGECALPAGIGPASGRLLGVTTDAQATDGRAVAVRKLGIALVEAASAIALGDAVEAADTEGRVRTVTGLVSSEGTNILGYAETSASAAGDLVEVFLSIGQYIVPV